MTTKIDKPEIVKILKEVRCDSEKTTWATFHYNENNVIVPFRNGEDFSEIYDCFQDDERVYAYFRVETGDEMSIRSKFGFLIFIGPSVSPLKRARCSTDKASVQETVGDFASSFQYDDVNEIVYENLVNIIKKAGGANYNAQAN